ncbi:MAG: CBS domain-containing protein [Burkholderiales bacterium]|nr:MAG: CBS domain-containing protein [Burkholderiales bacterium]
MHDHLPPPSHTPLIALRALVLDLETTGLDVRNDRVVQIGAIPMLGDRRLDGEEYERLVDPGMPIPEEATRIHRIADADVAGEPRFADRAAELHELLTGRIVIGHNIAFDMAVLRYEAARASIAWREPPALDLGQMLGALEPALPDLGMETVMSYLGVEIEGRHSAIGDCRAAARAWARLLALLREADVRTLGEARALAARRIDLEQRHIEAGWHAKPGAPPGVPQVTSTAPRIDRYTFERRIDALMHSPPTMVAPGTMLRAAARTMIEHRIGAVLVGEPQGRPLGILTERDLMRAVGTDAADLDHAMVAAAMSTPVVSMTGDELMYRALGRMDRLGIRHLCVVDESGIAVGMLSQRDLLHHRARRVDVLGDMVSAAHDAPALAAAFAWLPTVAGGLLSEGLGGVDIARVVSAELRALTSRAAEIAADQMQSEGHGPAPAPWCMLVLGSGGRGESLLGADQDNALIHDGTSADDAWFARFGAIVSDLLDAAGVARCKGGVMASNPQWRGTVAEWRARVDGWLRRGRPQDLLNVDIFFDLVPVAGETELAHTLHEDAVDGASGGRAFIGLLAESVSDFAPRLGMFGRLHAKNGRVNLKRDGLLPLVMVARTLGLRVGSSARATPERLRDAAAAGRISEGEERELIGLHELLLTLMVRQQLDDLEEGVPLSTRAPLRALAKRERSALGHGLRGLHTLISQLRGTVSAG